MDKQIILFGAGKKGIEALDFFGTKNVYCFVDNYKFGGELCNKDIISFGELLKVHNEYRVIISMVLNKEEISKQLQEYNIPFGVYASPFKKSPERIKVDILDILDQLNSDKARALINRFMTWNHRWIALLEYQNKQAAKDRYDFIKEKMPNAVFTLNQFEVIRSKATAIMSKRGSILDLGVYKGGSTRQLASIFTDCIINGFDSFEGLPDDWAHCLKGTFGEVEGVLPYDMPDNVRLFKGWFNDTLPIWLENNSDKPISLLRVDCDIYPSAKTIFDVLNPLLVDGTWICFDELIGYRGYENNEYRVLTEFLNLSGFTFEYVAFGLTYALGYLKQV